VSIVSDGEAHCGSLFILLTFKHQLTPHSPIYHLLCPLRLLDLHVGEDDLTCDKDWKHIFKHFRNLLLQQRGVVVNRIRVTSEIIRDHLKSVRLSADHIRSLFNPDDQQDVKMAFDLLKDIWTLPRKYTNTASPGISAVREALWILGKLPFHLMFPYLCVDLSLSEQIEHLSAGAHLALGLYNLAGKNFILTNLLINVMIMIKNVVFCVAKAKVEDPEGEFWIILLGTDWLEELFGILQTMVGNDANLDVLQLVSRLSGTTEVSNILAKYPQWDHASQRLKLPALTRESEAIPDCADHIKPASWRGNVNMKDVSLQTSWNRRQHLAEQDCDFLGIILSELDKDENINILAPSGTILFNVPLADDDINESLEFPSPPPAVSDHNATAVDADSAEIRVEVEDALGELALDAPTILPQNPITESEVLINRKMKSKA